MEVGGDDGGALLSVSSHGPHAGLPVQVQWSFWCVSPHAPCTGTFAAPRKALH